MIFIVICAIISLAVLVHYEFLYRISAIIHILPIKPRFRIVVGVLGALVAHSVEVLLFATAYYLLPHFNTWGHFEGNFDGTFQDCMYFAFTTFTTLGLGDIEPHGHIRHLVGLESLTGLLLITWSASFLFVEMQRYWNKR